MKKSVSKKGWILILGVLAFGLIGVELLHRYGPAAQQWENILLARRYAEKKTEEIERRKGFEHITVSEFTGLNGSVIVHGVLKERNEEELKAIIYTEELPTEVSWRVQVFDEESWQEWISHEESRK